MSEAWDFTDLEYEQHVKDMDLFFELQLQRAAVVLEYLTNRPSPGDDSTTRNAKLNSLISTNLDADSIYDFLLLAGDLRASSKISERSRVAGSKGGNARSNRYQRFREWILANAVNRKKDDKAIARELAAVLPAEFQDVSEDPERFIYDTIRSKPKN